MAVTRINNNQITDAASGNAYVGINAGSKLQAYSITSTKIANNLTYGSNLTITGNLTVQGTTTSIDTVNTLIQDPLITLADGQVSGTPTLDIGLIGLRGSQNSSFIGWKESSGTFVTALSNTTVSNTTVNVSSYANLATGNLTVQGTTSLVGNLIGAVNSTGNITGGNLLTPGLISATGNITGGNISATNHTGTNVSVTGTVTAASTVGGVITGSSASVTGTVTAASTVGGVITGSSASVTGTVTAASTVGGVITGSSASVTGAVSGASASVSGGVTAASVAGGVITGTSTSVTGTTTAASVVGGVITGTSLSVSGNVTGGNVLFGTGNVSGTGNIAAGYFIGNGSQLTGVTASSVNANSLTGTVLNSGVVTSSLTSVGVLTSLSVSGNVTAGNVSATNHTGTNVSVTGTVTAASTVGGVITGTSTSVTGSQTAASTVGGVITGSSVSVTGTATAASTVGGVITGSSSSVTGTQSAASTVGGVITGSSSSVTGTQTAASTVGGVITGTSASVTGNVTGANLNGSQVYSAGTLTITNASGNINISPTGNLVLNNNYLTGLQLNPVGNTDAATKYYVDTMISSGISYHQPVNAASTTTMATTTGGTITYNQPNGVSNGVGATLKTTGSFNLIDTANIQNINSRILIKDEANAVFNGVYNWANSTTLIRTTDTDEYGPNSVEQLSVNDYFFVTSGNVNAGSAWVVNSPTGVITFGSSNITFSQFSSSQTYSAGNGINITGTVISARVDNNTTAFDGSQNIIVKAGANLTTPNIGAATGTSLSVTGAVTSSSVVGGIITGTSTSVTGSQTAASTVGGIITGTSVSTTGNISTAATGNISTGNISASGNIVATGNVSAATHTGTNVSVTGTQTAASTVGGVITGSSTSVTGTQTAASTVGGVITGSSVSVTGSVSGASASVSGGVTAASVAGGVITGTSTSVTGTQTAASTVGGVITGSSSSVTGTQTAASTVGGVITGSSSSVTGNVTGGNILTSGNISATANITASYYFGNGSQLTGVTASTSGFPVVAGTSNISAATNGNIGISIGGASNIGLFTLSGLTVVGVISANGNVTGGNINTGGIVSATGNIVTGTNGFIGIGISTPDSELTILGNPQTVSYPVTGNSTTQGTDLHITGADGSNTRITQDAFGTGSYVAFTGRAGRGTAASPTQTQSGDSLALFSARGFSNGSLQFGNTSTGYLGIVAAENFSDTSRATNVVVYTTAAGAITPTAVATFSSASGLSVTGAVTATGNANIANATFFVNSSTNTASFGNSTQVTNSIVSMNATTSFIVPVGSTAQRPGTGVTGMQRFNTTTNSLEMYYNSAWTAVGAPVFTVIADQQFNGDGAQVAFTLSSTQTTNSCIVSINGVVQIPTIAYAVAGTDPTCVLTFTEAPAAGDLIDVRQITTTTSVTSLSSGNTSITLDGTNINITGNLNPTGNGTANIGNATNTFNTVFAKATTAAYADLAEKYVADATYEPGTVLDFGGEFEVTQSTEDMSSAVAGVVSTNPGFVMNEGLTGDNVVAVAFTGRVPCKVTGSVSKGDLMVSAGNGQARAETDPRVGTVIGKALADSNGDAVIEVVVGRF